MGLPCARQHRAAALRRLCLHRPPDLPPRPDGLLEGDHPPRRRCPLHACPRAGQPVTVTIADDQGNQLLQQKLTLSPLGTVDGKLELGPDAGLGYYYISVQMDKEHSYGVGFQVAEYRKPEYELSAQADKPEYVQGEQINVTVQASYFFGGPVKNGKVRWTLMSADAPFDYQGKELLQLRRLRLVRLHSRSARSATQISQGEGTTDAEGRFTFSVPADIAKFKRSQRFTFDITVQDVNNQAVSTQATAVVHKGDFYIGLQPRSYVPDRRRAKARWT